MGFYSFYMEGYLPESEKPLLSFQRAIETEKKVKAYELQYGVCPLN
jgi:hypothetical protein